MYQRYSAFQMIWRRSDWVARQTCFSHPTKGGLGVYCIQTRMQAFNIKHHGAFLTKPAVKWHHYTRYFVSIRVVNLSLERRYNLRPDSEVIPPYYKHTLGLCKSYFIYLFYSINTVKLLPGTSIY